MMSVTTFMITPTYNGVENRTSKNMMRAKVTPIATPIDGFGSISPKRVRYRYMNAGGNQEAEEIIRNCQGGDYCRTSAYLGIIDWVPASPISSAKKDCWKVLVNGVNAADETEC